MQNAKLKMQNAKCKMQNAKCRMQNAECKIQNSFKKNKVCEHFSVRRTRVKRTHQNSANTKIVNDEIIFVPNEGTKAQHSRPM